MKKIIMFFKRMRTLKMWADKHQFTIRFNVLDAPTESTRKCIAEFYPRKGWKRYIKLIFGNEGDNISFYLDKTKTKQNEAQFSLSFESSFDGSVKTINTFNGIAAGSVYILTVTFGNEIQVRLNNRVATIAVDLSDVSSGYRVYNISKEMTDDGWLVKML